MVEIGQTLWEPSEEWIKNTNLCKFQQWLQKKYDLKFESLTHLRRWSVDNIDDFWRAIWEYFEVDASELPHAVLGKRAMPGAEWFPGAKLNYAWHIMRNEKPDTNALFYASEKSSLQGISWEELGANVRKLAVFLRNIGVKPGDRVACYLPNIPEAVTVLLATTSIGAVVASCSPDFGTPSVLDRLSQIEPKVLFAVDGYYYKGKPFDRKQEVANIVISLPSIEQVVYLPYMNPEDQKTPVTGALLWSEVLSGPDVSAKNFQYEQVPFDQPLWILFSSGTTGLPKPIVHSHGGILLEQFKLAALHYDLKPDDRYFFFTTTGWMMWNFIVSAMITEARPILFDGNPTWPKVDGLWQLADEAGARLFGASPTLQQMQENAGVVPKSIYELKNLEIIMLAGSPVSAECTNWFYENVKKDLYVAPGSGGTDICSGFCGPLPGLPVKAGVIQMPHLAVDLQVFDDDGNSMSNQVGEFVVTQPMPSMPLYLWNDKNNQRYIETYFETYPGIWRQGDYLRIDEEEGCYVLGRSDATLNRFGVRIGTAEIYRSVESLEEIEDSIIINLDLPGEKFFMPLFVKVKDGVELTDQLKQEISKKLRADYSPRHVPDQIYSISEIPYTLTGKKMEIPIKKILMGVPIEKAANKDAMSNPQSLDYFIKYRITQNEYSLD